MVEIHPSQSAPPPIEHGAPRDRLIGILLVAVAAAAFSLSAVMGRVAFDGGSDPVTVIFGRFVIGTFVLAGIATARRRSFRLAKDKRLGVVLLGLAVTLSSLAYFTAITRIPISLAVLIFYTFPVFVGIASRFTEREPLTPAKIGTLLLAFAGIAITLDPQVDGLDPLGLALACVPALAIGGVTLFGGRVMAGQSVSVMNCYMMAVGTVLAGAVLAATGGPAWPQTGQGWAGFFAVPAAFTTGSLLYFSAFRRAKPVDMAMALNMEPVTTILFAIALLGEVLLPIQYAGAAMVVAGVILMTLIRR